MSSIQEISARVEEIIRAVLKLGDDVRIGTESDLVDEIGLDSIEAFEMVSTLHDLLGVGIPENLDPKSLASIGRIADYVSSTCTPEQVQSFLVLDFKERLASLQDDDVLS